MSALPVAVPAGSVRSRTQPVIEAGTGLTLRPFTDDDADALVRLRRVELMHTVHNEPSCRVATKNGFELEGIRRSALLHPDGWHDMHAHARIAPS